MSSTFIRGGLVRANGIRQRYLRFGGSGKPIIIVPGITSPAVTWAEFAEPLGKDFDIFILDVRGRGLSSSGPEFDYRINALAADVAAFAEAMSLTNYGLLGHSMGGRIAPAAVVRYGAKPAQMMLIDPPLCGPGHRGLDSTHEWYTDQIYGSAHGNMTVDEMRPYFPSWTDAQLQLRIEWVHTCDPRAIIAFREDVVIDNLHADIPKLTIPTQLVVGGLSPVITLEEEAEVAALNPLFNTIRIPDAGHMVPWDTYDIFYTLTHELFGGA
jgi:N-formylmaleamate deformylase